MTCLEILDLFCQLFADDTTLQVEGQNLIELFQKTTEQLLIAQHWFNCNKLTLNLKKTKFVLFSNHNLINLPIPPLQIGTAVIDRVGNGCDEEMVRFLGLWVDDKLRFTAHVAKIKNKINQGLYHLAKAKENSPLRVRLSIYRALIESHFRFACTTYGSAPRASIEELFILQKKAIRHVTRSFYLAHTEPLFKKLGILKISDLIVFERALLIFNYRKNNLPGSFHRNYYEFVTEGYTNRRALYIKLPEINFKNLARSPYVMTAEAWNSVPYDIKLLGSKKQFKIALNAHLLSKYTSICSELNCRACLLDYQENSDH